MKSQQSSLILVLVFGLIIVILVSLLYPTYFGERYSKSWRNVDIENRVKLAVSNLENVHNKSSGLTYLQLLSYVVESGNQTFCVKPGECFNVSDLLIEYFDHYFGKNWNLTIYIKPPGLKGWIIRMFVVTGNSGDWDVCAYNPPKDDKGRNWWEYDYNDSFFVKDWSTTVKGKTIKGAGWVLVSAPFHEYNSFNQWGLRSLYKGYANPLAVRNGICIPIYKILPGYTTTNASVYCPNTEWDLFGNFGTSSSSLPTNYDFGYYYSSPPVYKTATDITVLAYELGLIDYYCISTSYDCYEQRQKYNKCVVGSFYRGEVKIDKRCRRVYLDAPWHEVIRLYIAYINKSKMPDYVWLSADPTCSLCPLKGNGDGKVCPIFRNYGSSTYVAGIYRFNITKWVIYDRDPSNDTIVIANAYWDPHCGSNGASMVRVYCFDDKGKKYELNEYFYMKGTGTERKIVLGHPIPKGRNIYSFKIWLPMQNTLIPAWYAILKVW